MSRALPLAALALLVLPGPLAAASWEKVDELPGGYALEIDRESEVGMMDGVVEAKRATFRRELPTGMVETAIDIDCEHKAAKIRSVRLLDGDTVMGETITNFDDYTEIRPGSAEALYFKALCYGEIPLPPMTEAEQADYPPPDDADESEEPVIEGEPLG